jgi:uncharacterized protein
MWRQNLAKTGASFAQAATVLLDPLALTAFDAAHSQDEERWFTLGTASDGKLLGMSHTYQATGPLEVKVRIISEREAIRRERQQYEDESRYGNAMNQNPPDDDDMPAEMDFAGGKRGVLPGGRAAQFAGVPGAPSAGSACRPRQRQGGGTLHLDQRAAEERYRANRDWSLTPAAQRR